LDDRISIKDSASRSLSRKQPSSSENLKPIESDFGYQNEDTVLNLVQ
jgi:hypothetical protein